MASGILGQAAVSDGSVENVYTVPATMVTACSINIVNVGNIAANVYVAFSDDANENQPEYFEYASPLMPSEVLERTGIVIQAGKNVLVRSEGGTLNVTVYGYEEV